MAPCLEKGCVYVVPLDGRARPAPDMTAVANAKSSTGRLDLLTRTITDHGVEFDRIARGYSGPLYAEICPRSFSVLVRPGMRLNQIRFRLGHAVSVTMRCTHCMPNAVGLGRCGHRRRAWVFGGPQPRSQCLVGYRAKPHTGVIDLGKIGHYDPADFWEEVARRIGRSSLIPARSTSWSAAKL